MKTYKLKSSAVRAAKKEMGEDWAQFAAIAPQGDEFVIELKSTAAIAPGIEKSIAAVALLAENDAAIALKADKKAEIESRKPVHIPAKPSNEPVTAPIALKSIPALPAFLKSSPPAEKEVAIAQTDEELTNIQKMADKIANANSVNVDPVKPRISICDLPTKKVWHIADEMMDAAKKAGIAAPKRKEVIEECVRRGVAYGTARTQYQHWFKTMNDSATAPIAVIGADGKVTMPGK